jgi:glycosyltransferase involved in cell wall biosynthesis
MNNALSVLFVNYEYPPIGGGGGATSRFLAEALARQGHRVHVLTGALRGHAGVENTVPGLIVERLETGRARSDICSVVEMARFILAAGPRLRSLLRGCRPDVVHIFFGMPTGAVLLFSGLRRAQPYFISLLGGDVPGFLPAETGRMHAALKWLTRRLWSRAAAVMPNSAGLAQLARNTLQREYDIVSNGVDSGFFHPHGACTEEGPLRMIFVGRIVAQKGLDVLIDALARLDPSLPYTLTVVGDGPQRIELERRAHALGVAAHIHWQGWVALDMLREMYREHHVLVLPSRFEGMASVMLQAMASGCAVISSDVFGARDVLGDGMGGIIVPIDDTAALAEGITALHETSARGRLRRQALNKVQAFSWSALAERTVEIYRSAMRGGAAQPNQSTIHRVP